MPLLRRPHDHHRDLRARCNATASADRAGDPHQDRYLMITSRLRKNVRSPRRFSSGHGTVRRDIRLSRQTTQTFAMLVPARRPFSSRCTVRQLVLSRRPPSAAVRAAPKSPYRALHPTRPASRVFLPWSLSDAGPGVRRPFRDGPSSESLPKTGTWPPLERVLPRRYDRAGLGGCPHPSLWPPVVGMTISRIPLVGLFGRSADRPSAVNSATLSESSSSRSRNQL